MPSNAHQCDKEVKAAFPCHHTCNKKRSVHKTGSYLNRYVKCTTSSTIPNENKKFESQQKFKVCMTLDLLFDASIKKQPRINKQKVLAKEPMPAKVLVEPSVPAEQVNLVISREERRRSRAILRDGTLDENAVKKLKTVTIKVNDSVLEDSINFRYKRTSPKQKFLDQLGNLSSNYKYPYSRLKQRQRIERVDEITKRIISMCVDRSQLSNKGFEYLDGNIELSHQVLNIVNSIKERLEDHLNVDLGNTEYPDACELDSDDDNKDNMKMKDASNKLGSTILLETSGRGYDRIRRKLKEEQTVTLPSVYMINKQLPLQVDALSYAIQTNLTQTSVKTKEREEVLLGTASDIKTEEEALVLLSDKLSNQDGNLEIVGAKLSGSLNNFVDLMVSKVMRSALKHKVDVIDGEDLILLNSFDGAEAIKTKKKITSVISFSSSIITSSTIQNKVLQAGSSSNILTWQQVIAKEDLPTMQKTLESYIIKRQEYVLQNLPVKDLPLSKVWCYDIHDAKMLYLLTQHSLWNRKHHPFLMCNCKRGESLLNIEDHQCSFITDDAYSKAWQRSNRRWDTKRMRSGDETYNESHHKNWCDVSNQGITHFGLSPLSFPLSTLRFDIFHLSAAITRRVMTYLRKLMLKQSLTLRKRFSKEVLLSIWPEFLVYCWNNNLNFSKFQGPELSKFVSNSTMITDFIEVNLLETVQTVEFSRGLNLLKSIFKCMSISYIIEDDEICTKYLKKLELFEVQLKQFYSCGKHTYLTGGDESFYFHCFRFYLPKIARLTLARHRLGLGIFTMQGFERRNKESKNMIKKASTLNRNSPAILVNNVKRLLQVFCDNEKY